MEPRQVFKNRVAAHTWLEQKGIKVSQSSFFAHANKERLIQPDKTVLLCDLLAYVEKYHHRSAGLVGPRSTEAEDLAKRKELADVERSEADARTAKVKADEAERAASNRWIEVIDHDRQMAALAGQIEACLEQHTTIKLSELVYLCGGDIRKAAEFSHGLKSVYDAAITEAVSEQTRTIVFEEEAQGADSGD